MKDNFIHEYTSLLQHSQEIVEKYKISCHSDYQWSVPDNYRHGWSLICNEDEQKIRAMIKLLDELEKETTELKTQLEDLKKTGCINQYDYYFPCGGGSLIESK